MGFSGVGLACHSSDSGDTDDASHNFFQNPIDTAPANFYAAMQYCCNAQHPESAQ